MVPPSFWDTAPNWYWDFCFADMTWKLSDRIGEKQRRSLKIKWFLVKTTLMENAQIKLQLISKYVKFLFNNFARSQDLVCMGRQHNKYSQLRTN
jgi:hypothetical protein